MTSISGAIPVEEGSTKYVSLVEMLATLSWRQLPGGKSKSKQCSSFRNVQGESCWWVLIRHFLSDKYLCRVTTNEVNNVYSCSWASADTCYRRREIQYTVTLDGTGDNCVKKSRRNMYDFAMMLPHLATMDLPHSEQCHGVRW